VLEGMVGGGVSEVRRRNGWREAGRRWIGRGGDWVMRPFQVPAEAKGLRQAAACSKAWWAAARWVERSAEEVDRQGWRLGHARWISRP
jgi:hypothetical protein